MTVIAMKPRRIQRSRAKGWQMPPNTVYVGRGSRWGNPFVIKLCGSREEALKRYRRLMTAGMPWRIAEAREELRGKNLACWCRLDTPCHADILLELANRRER